MSRPETHKEFVTRLLLIILMFSIMLIGLLGLRERIKALNPGGEEHRLDEWPCHLEGVDCAPKGVWDWLVRP